MAAFCSNTTFLLYYDARTIGDMVSDDGNRVSSGSLAANAVLTKALASASGEILRAAMRGARYSEEDLAGLTGNGAASLEHLTADLAYYFLLCRRGMPIEEHQSAVEAREELERLEHGDRIFDLDTAANAGHAQSPAIDQTVIREQRYIRDISLIFPPRRNC